ncbi:MAG: hypothetical protein H6559_34145 [Lewinellaceae bacterium]|nr:hypothetical protein [Lewinellaceae bacterium]
MPSSKRWRARFSCTTAGSAHRYQLSYVEGALVSAPFTTTESTNRKYFKLEFAGADGGNFIAVNVEKPGLSAVNLLDLQGIAIGTGSAPADIPGGRKPDRTGAGGPAARRRAGAQ